MKDVCMQENPELEAIGGDVEAFFACHRYKELNLKGYI
jgi:hypothetical protein